MKEMLTKVAKGCGDITAERNALRAQLEALTSDRAVEAAGEALKTFLLANNDEDIEANA